MLKAYLTKMSRKTRKSPNRAGKSKENKPDEDLELLQKSKQILESLD